jgi:hypothetical protein
VSVTTETVVNDPLAARFIVFAARRWAFDAQAVQRKERADLERRLEGLAVAVTVLWGARCSGPRSERPS